MPWKVGNPVPQVPASRFAVPKDSKFSELFKQVTTEVSFYQNGKALPIECDSVAEMGAMCSYFRSRAEREQIKIKVESRGTTVYISKAH